jgi:hypothetical protein
MNDEHDSRVRRILLSGWAGRQFDTIPEMAMHTGLWISFFGIGALYGHIRPDGLTLAAVALGIGAIIGVAGQLAVEVGGRD